MGGAVGRYSARKAGGCGQRGLAPLALSRRQRRRAPPAHALAWGVLYGTLRFSSADVGAWSVAVSAGFGWGACDACASRSFGYEGANKGELLLLCVGAGFGAFVLFAWFYDSIVITPVAGTDFSTSCIGRPKMKAPKLEIQDGSDARQLRDKPV